MPLEADAFPWLARAAFVAIQLLVAATALLGWRAAPGSDPRQGPGLRVLCFIAGGHALACLALVLGYLAAGGEAWRLPVTLGVYALVVFSFLPQVAMIRDAALRQKTFHRVLPFHAVGCLVLVGAAVML